MVVPRQSSPAVAKALRNRVVRCDELYIVSKVYSLSASRRGVSAACSRSLDRVGIEQIDFYLLHGRRLYPLAETVAGFETLPEGGRIRH